MKYLSDSNAKLTYEITSVDVEAMKVSITCNYVDSTEFIGNFMKEVLSYAFSQAFSGDNSDISDDKIDELTQKAIEQVEEEKIKSKDIVLSFKEDEDGYILSEMDEDLLDVATAGIYDAVAEIGDSFTDSDVEGTESDIDYNSYADKIDYDIANTETGAVITFTNNSDMEVDVHADVIFKDLEGNMVEEGSKDVPSLSAGKSKKVGIEIYNGKYESIDIQVSTSQPYYNDYSDLLLVESNDADDGVIIKATNDNTEENVEEVVAYVFFFKDGECVGFAYDINYDNVSPGNFVSLTVSHPYERDNYDDIQYDDFETVVYGYSYR